MKIPTQEEIQSWPIARLLDIYAAATDGVINVSDNNTEGDPTYVRVVDMCEAEAKRRDAVARTFSTLPAADLLAEMAINDQKAIAKTMENAGAIRYDD